MTGYTLAVVRRPRRRTHLADPLTGPRVATWCGLDVPAIDASGMIVPLIGGATAALRNELVRELDGNTCKRCTRIAYGMLVLYASRDGGRPW